MSQKEKIQIESIIYDEQRMERRMMEVAANVRAERENKGLSISELAELANLSTSCIFKTETGKSAVSLKTILKIAASLEIPVSQLVEPTMPKDTCEAGNAFEKITEHTSENATEFLLDMAENVIHALRRTQKENEGEREN